MPNHNLISRAAGVSLLSLVLLLPQPVRSETSGSDSDRLQKLEQAVEQLQKRNAELEKEVRSLKKQTSAAPAAPAEGPSKIQKSYDGKTYVEKSVPVEPEKKSPWKLSLPLTELELYGDVRLRYEYRGGQTDDNSPLAAAGNNSARHDDWQERERERYRIRLGLRGTVLDDWFFGVRLETSQNPRSTNVTFGDDTGGGTTTNGPFAKVSDGINVGQAYIGYKGFPDIVLMGGKMPLNNVLVTTRMVWDDDINPEGLSESWKHTFTFGSTSEASVASYSKGGYSKDGTALPATVKSEPFLKLDLFANFAQFVYDDSNPENPLGSRATVPAPSSPANNTHQAGQLVPTDDAFMLAWQIGARLNFPKNIYVQLAPTIYNYTGNGDTFNIHYQGGDPTLTNAASVGQNQTGINSLLIYDMPFEIGWKLWSLPMRAFGDFAVNFDGDDRARAAGHPGKGDQRYAIEAGLGVGQLKKKHDWQIEAWYQHQEQYSLDPNLIDSDLFSSQLNLEGPVVRAGYMLTDAVWVNLSWGYAWRIDHKLGTGGVSDIAINPVDEYQIFQADLNLKF